MVFSVHTNGAAMAAMWSFNATQTQLARVQKEISTGYKVADATDNGAVFAIAQGVRADLAGIAASNQQLSGALGMVSVAEAAATGISNTMAQIRSTITELADGTYTGSSRTSLLSHLNQLTATVSNFIANATYGGTNLLSSGATNVGVITNSGGAQYNIQAQDLVNLVLGNLTAITSTTDAQGLLTGGFSTAMDAVGTALASLGGDENRINSQISFNSQISDAMSTGLGAMVDADMAKAAAQLQALQVREQLAVQAMSIANQSMQLILSLFR
ncbi:MAG: flagellin [Azospirillaceae bacterium]|nr:flagellin [Azospirillaceae bacterium]